MSVLSLLANKLLGPQHPQFATSYSNLALLLGDQGDLKQGKEYHERALAISQQTFGASTSPVCNFL